jgi:hypothetical protein
MKVRISSFAVFYDGSREAYSADTNQSEGSLSLHAVHWLLYVA